MIFNKYFFLFNEELMKKKITRTERDILSVIFDTQTKNIILPKNKIIKLAHLKNDRPIRKTLNKAQELKWIKNLETYSYCNYYNFDISKDKIRRKLKHIDMGKWEEKKEIWLLLDDKMQKNIITRMERDILFFLKCKENETWNNARLSVMPYVDCAEVTLKRTIKNGIKNNLLPENYCENKS